MLLIMKEGTLSETKNTLFLELFSCVNLDGY